KIAGGTTLLRTQVEISRRVLALRTQPALAAVHERLLADALAGRGAWNSALVVAERFARHPHSEAPLAAYRLAVIGAWRGPHPLAPGYVTHAYVIAVSGLAAARWLLSDGDTTRAVPLLSWFDAGWALDGYRPARRVLLAFAQLERARVAEARGDTALARREY